MAKKRTKAQKQKAMYSFTGFAKDGFKPNPKRKAVDNQSFFGYDLSLIYKDLAKTGVVTSIVVAVLLIILIYN